MFRASSLSCVILLHAALLFTASDLFCQGPRPSYYYQPTTILDWACCELYFAGGSSQRIGFLPVVGVNSAPCGTERFSRDIAVEGPVVFAGNGIARAGRWDSYQGVDPTGKIVLLCYDFPDSVNGELEREFTPEARIDTALARGAVAVVLCSWREAYPFRHYQDRDPARIPARPVITVNLEGAARMLEAAGLDSEQLFAGWRDQGEVASRELICRLRLRIDGRFAAVDNESFTIRYRPDEISGEQLARLAEVNSRAVELLGKLFEAPNLAWNKTLTVYFRDYDSKLFFTHHWGRGLAYAGASFMVFDGREPDFALAVHEHTHTLFADNWGHTSSFVAEGLGRYSEARATDPALNDRETAEHLRQGRLVPLRELLNIQIGSDQLTAVAYPAAG